MGHVGRVTRVAFGEAVSTPPSYRDPTLGSWRLPCKKAAPLLHRKASRDIVSAKFSALKSPIHIKAAEKGNEGARVNASVRQTRTEEQVVSIWGIMA